MIHVEIVDELLLELNVSALHFIWFASREKSTYYPVKKYDKHLESHLLKVVPKQVQYFNQPTHITKKNHYTYIYLEYPNQYQLVVFIDQVVHFTSKDLKQLYFHLYPYYTKQALKEEKYKLEKMIESIGHTTSSLDLEELFANILSNTLDVIPNADLGTLWLYKPESKRLVCKASVGNLLEGIANMQFEVGEGPIGYTFQLESPLLFGDLTNMSLSHPGMKEISSENTQYWDDTYDLSRKVKSSMTCPIVVGDQVECVMFLCQIKTKNRLTERDLHLLQGFSSQVGIAIRNAKQFTHIKKLNHRLLKQDYIHKTLTNISLQNTGFKKIIQELRKMIGQPIIFVDLLENEHIPSSSKLPDFLSYHRLIHLTSQKSQKRFYEVKIDNKFTHYIFPIRSGKVILGCLIIEAKRSLKNPDYMALEQGSSILALELVNKQNIVEYFYKNKRDLFNALLQSKDLVEINKKANELGINKDLEFSCLIFQFSSHRDTQFLEANVHRLIAQIKTELPKFIQTVFGYHNKVVLLVSLSNHAEKGHFQELVEALINNWMAAHQLNLRCGMGSLYKGIQLIEKSYKEAKNALSYLTTRRIQGFIEYSNIGINRLFINQNSEEIERFFQETFYPLRKVDGASNNLEETLITYFKLNRSATDTAKRLHIHINTLYQRLKKIEESLDLSLKDPEDVLHLQLACYLKESFRPMTY